MQERLETFIEHVSIPPQLIFGIVQASRGRGCRLSKLPAVAALAPRMEKEAVPRKLSCTGHGLAAAALRSRGWACRRPARCACHCAAAAPHPVPQGEAGEDFVEHLQVLASKLEYVSGDDTARFSAAFRCAPRCCSPAAGLLLSAVAGFARARGALPWYAALCLRRRAHG